MGERRKVAKPPVTDIDPYFENVLKCVVVGKQLLRFAKNTPVFSQGERADSIYFLQSGKVKIAVVSSRGKEAVIAMVGPRKFFGEGCLVGQPFRITTATATEPSVIFRVLKESMLRALHTYPELSENFTAALLSRNMDLEEDLCDQLFNHSEKRLARVLLKLSRLGEQANMPDAVLPRLTHETLAEMVGTTRSRITFFMNKFKKLKVIEYTGKGDISVKEDLLTDIVLHN